MTEKESINIVILPLGDVVGREGGSVVGGQCDEVMEHPSHLARLKLETLYLLVRQHGEGGVVVVGGHELVPRVHRHVLPLGCHHVVRLLPEVQGPVEGRAVVVHKLRVGNLEHWTVSFLELFYVNKTS